MINFQYSRATDVADAIRQAGADPRAKFIAGGTNLLDLMKEDVSRPSRLIDISKLAAQQGSRDRRMAVFASAHWCQILTSPIIR